MTRLQTNALGTIGLCLLWPPLYMLFRLSGFFDPYRWTMFAFLPISIIPVWMFARRWRNGGAPVETDELEERIAMKSYQWVGQGALLYFTVFLILVDTQKGYAIIQHNLPAFFFGMLITIWISQSLGILYYSARPEAARLRMGRLDLWLLRRRGPLSRSENHPGPEEDR
ncbi:hypothetical protein LLH00_02130 [bacterium]|nr:hypothetical protein [bacterium]